MSNKKKKSRFFLFYAISKFYIIRILFVIASGEMIQSNRKNSAFVRREIFPVFRVEVELLSTI